MQGKELIIKILDLLVEMAEHCVNKEKTTDKSKCVDCALSWNFSIYNCGCFLVELVDNNDKFMDELINLCKLHNIDYIDKLNKVASIFTTESE